MGKKISKDLLKMNKEALKKVVLSEREKYSSAIPPYISRQFQVDELIESKCKCYRIIPRDSFDGTYIVYLYGGHMCMNIRPEQWEFIYNLCDKTGTGLFVPMYPLAPEFSCGELFKMLIKAYSNFARGIDVEKIIMLGDGHGAGLALSLTLLAWEEGFRKPDKLIMLSPVLDTEFFDKKLEARLLKHGIDKNSVFYNEAVKDFLNTYWVKDYAVQTQYTSPYYCDCTDLCDDVVIFAGERELYFEYAREFYNKAKNQAVNIRFYLFDEETSDFIVNTNTEVQKTAFKYLLDVINGTYYASEIDLYPMKVISYWSKKDPDIIKDEWVDRFIHSSKYDFNRLKDSMSEYRKLLMISRIRACDELVRQFVMKYPKSTIVNVGCRLNNIFKRVDNGKINWYSVDTYNTIAVRRALFGEVDREKTIGRSIMDFSWLDEINCKRNQGVMFLFSNTLCGLNIHQVEALLSQIRDKFPSAEVVFTATSKDATIFNNLFLKKKIWSRGRINMSIDDSETTVFGWRQDYRIMGEEPIMKYRPKTKIKKLGTKIAVKYNMITNNQKVLHLKLGREEYDVNI